MVVFRVTRKFLKILSRHQKLRIIELIIMMIIGGFMEMFSVSLIMPFAQAIMEPEKIMNNQYVIQVCSILDIADYKSLMFLLAIVMAILYVVKNAMLIFQMNMQYRFVYNNMFMTQKRLLHSYLSRPYEYFLDINSGEVLRIIRDDTNNVFIQLTSLLTMMAEMVVSIMLVATVFCVSPQITLLLAAILIIVTFIILKIIRPYLEVAGEQNRTNATNMNQWLLQALQGIKELKIMRRQEFFEAQYDRSGAIHVRSTYKYIVLSTMPRYLIETVVLSSMFVIIAIMIGMGHNLEALVPLITVIAMASVRLLPAVNRIAQCVSAITFGEPMLDKMIEILDTLPEPDELSRQKTENKSSIPGFKNTIAFHELNYKYPGASDYVLKNAGIRINKGESVGIIGVSGAGKTTVIDILLGLLHPNSGCVTVDDVDIASNIDGWTSQIGYIPQNIFLLDGNIRQNVAFGLEDDEINNDMVWSALHLAALDEYVRGLPDGLYTELGERGLKISGGQKQRIGIARALYYDPEVLVLDEATSALDSDTETEIMESVYLLHGKKTLIIIAHRLTTIQNCNVVYKVEDGRIVQMDEASDDDR